MVREETGELKKIGQKINNLSKLIFEKKERGRIGKLVQNLTQDSINLESLRESIWEAEEACFGYLNAHSSRCKSTPEYIAEQLAEKEKTLAGQKNILSQLANLVDSLDRPANLYVDIACFKITNEMTPLLPNVLINIVIKYVGPSPFSCSRKDLEDLCKTVMIMFCGLFPSGGNFRRGISFDYGPNLLDEERRKIIKQEIEVCDSSLKQSIKEFEQQKHKHARYLSTKNNFLNLKTEVDKLEPLCYSTAFYFQEINAGTSFHSKLIHIILAYVDFAMEDFQIFYRKKMRRVAKNLIESKYQGNNRLDELAGEEVTYVNSFYSIIKKFLEGKKLYTLERNDYELYLMLDFDMEHFEKIKDNALVVLTDKNEAYSIIEGEERYPIVGNINREGIETSRSIKPIKYMGPEKEKVIEEYTLKRNYDLLRRNICLVKLLDNGYITPKFLISLCFKERFWGCGETTLEGVFANWAAYLYFYLSEIKNNFIAELKILFAQLKSFLDRLDAPGEQEIQSQGIQSMFRFTFQSEASESTPSLEAGIKINC